MKVESKSTGFYWDKDVIHRADGSVDRLASAKANVKEVGNEFTAGVSYAKDALTSERTYRSASGFGYGMLKAGVGLAAAVCSVGNIPQAAYHGALAVFEKRS